MQTCLFVYLLSTITVLHRDRLASNVGNYGAFYGPSLAPATLWNAARLVVEGATPVITTVALLGGMLMVWSSRRPRYAEDPGLRRTSDAGLRSPLLLVAPAAVVAVQFGLLASHKPAEYARFALTPDVALAILAATAVARLPLRPREVRLAGVSVVAATALFGLRYDLNFLADAGPRSTRRTTARQLAALAEPGRTLSIPADPAPYDLPPVDLWAWRIVVGPDTPPGAVAVRPTDAAPAGLASPISWADKPFAVVAPARR